MTRKRPPWRRWNSAGWTPLRIILAKGLPIGERKRLEITRAMATQPQLLLLDETAAGLNPTEVDEAIDLIKKINGRGITIIIVEHIMKVIMTISEQDPRHQLRPDHSRGDACRGGEQQR